MGRITFQATNNSYDILTLNSNVPAGLTAFYNVTNFTLQANASIPCPEQYLIAIPATGSIVLHGGNIINTNNHSEFFISGVTTVEVNNGANIKLKNYDLVGAITIDSGSLLFNDHYVPAGGAAPAQSNITLTNSGKFTLDATSAAGSLANIGQVTMANGTIFEFDSAHHHYSITAPRDNLVLDDLVNMTKIAEFIDGKLNNNIINPQFMNNELGGLRAYANYQNKDALKEFIAINFGTNLKLVDNFIHDRTLHINGVCADSSTSILGDLPEEALAHINFYIGV